MNLGRILCGLAVAVIAAHGALANITSATLRIEGAGLKVVTSTVTTGIDMPATIQTEFGGKLNDEAVALEGVIAAGELTGPGLDTPIYLTTAPGHKFQIPGLPQVGVYHLQSVRLMKGAEFLQYASPAVAEIIVADLLQTTVTVKQLSAEDLRARGITVDARNYDVYDYTFTFIINGQTVTVTYPVIVDPRTHQVQPVRGEQPYVLPGPGLVEPPRWSPPVLIPMDFGAEGELPEPGQEPKERAQSAGRISIPAAIVIPNSLAVLHQFFGVMVMVQNGAPESSSARLEDIRGTIRIPTALRTVRTEPQVSFGQAVPIVEPVTGVTFLVAQARGEANWTLEGLQPGTHRLDFDIRATLRQPGQNDMPIRANPSAAIVVHDPRFNINFSHPDTVRKGIEYSTYAFITNMSATQQSVVITSGVEACDVNPNASVCRLSGTATDTLVIPAGDMRLIEYRLRSGVTGQVFATAGTLSSTDVLSASVRLHMGVSESGIPLSPATLILPHYAQFVAPDVVSANLELLGLGYSLATAPLNQMTARFPRVIKTDVFQRAVDIARAGQRVFIAGDAPAARRDSMVNLALDLLGNGGYELREWDQLRRQEKSGRTAGAAVMRELEATGLATGATMGSFVDAFASATAHRQGFVAALAHGGAAGERPYAIALEGRSSSRSAGIPNESEAGWVRTLPFSDISRFSGAGESGELALLGRWTEDIDVTVIPAQDGPFVVELLYPDTSDGSLKRARFDLSGARGKVITIALTRGASTLNALGIFGVSAVGTVTTVQPAPLTITAARQDLYLDEDGHKVSVLFNRPIKVPAGVDLRSKFTGAIDFNRDGVLYNGPRPIAAAALQEDGRTVNLTFDHALSQNATYTIATGSLTDPISAQSITFPGQTTPRIDNDLPGGVVYGKVLKGDNTPIAGVDVVIRQYLPSDGSPDPRGTPQYDVSRADGAFLFEFVRRQTDRGWSGAYRLEGLSSIHGHTSVEGSVRLPGKVHFVNLQYLGRGSAEGYVRYDSGQVVALAKVVVGSTMFDQFRTATTDANGFYRVDDLPVGPLTFSAQDAAGNIAYAAAEIATPGQLVTQNLSIFRKPFPGLGRVHGTVRRSDTSELLAGIHVAVFSQGYGLVDGYTDSAGRFEFEKIPAGFITVLAEEWSFARQSVASDFDLQANEVKQADLLFLIAPAMKSATLTGQVLRENPLRPGVQENVPGALVKISGYRIVTADGNGRFTYEDLPVVFGGKDITAYDPATKRSTTVALPTPLTESGPNNVALFIRAFDRGTGTIRVRLLNAAGAPVPNYRVIVPGFPPDVLKNVGNGVYELARVVVGANYEIWAVPGGTRPANGLDTRPYGDQLVRGDASVAFNGHVAALTLRLPGEGTVRVKVRSQFDLITPVSLGYSTWDEGEQHAVPAVLEQSTDKNGAPDWAVFTRIPALARYSVSSVHPQYGQAGRESNLAFDGDLQDHVLQLNTLATVRGTVYAIDGVTPVAGASVTIYNRRSDPGPQLTGPDGRFQFPDQPSDAAVTVTAQVTQSGIYRIGAADARTPLNGGTVDDMPVVLRKRGFVDGRVVYKDYKRFDASNVASNIPDDTPNDYSDNAPVPLAKFHLRELDFPTRTFGTPAQPLTADVAGRFVITNVFVGSLRATAWDSGNEDLRGDWSGALDEEGAEAAPKAFVAIGAGGVGSVTVRVVDPNQAYVEVANADVRLFRDSSPFDFSTTGSTGLAEFNELPAGTYKVSAYSKSLGKSSKAETISVTRDGVTSARLELEFSGSVEGTLSDSEAAGAPVPGVHVRLTGSNYATQSTTGTSGSFSFLGVREGFFRLDAKDSLTNRRASAERTLSILDPHQTVRLLLEPTETLHFAAYLPDDTGGRSNVLAPPTRVEVLQDCWEAAGMRSCEYERELHGNPVQFPGVLEQRDYRIDVWEAGFTAPQIRLSGRFPKGNAADPFIYIFPAFGEVRVTVTQGGGPAAGARVTIHGAGESITVYTDAAGLATARDVRLGNINVHAQSVDGRFNGSASTTLARQSVPAAVTLALGTYAGVTGYVEAEAGGPSTGTRIVATYGSFVGEIRTDPNGRYTFLGIPTPGTGTTRVNLTFIGPDDTTIGGTAFKDVGSGAGVAEVTPVKLDATPPLLESILPADGAVDVSPDASITVTFSEPLKPATISPNTFQLLAADGSGTVQSTLTSRVIGGGKFAVSMTPPAAATGLPLRSNTLYRVIVTRDVTDLTGHPLSSARGFTFTTSDYAEPRVLKVLPENPIPAATTFEFRFNEPIDPAPWQTGGNGVFRVQKLAAPGGAAAAVESSLAARAFVDPATSMTLFIAPEDRNPILPESYYRVVFSGVRDPQGNVLGEQTHHFSSFDAVAPHVVFASPPAAEQLVSGAEYEIKLDVRNGSVTGTPATDVKKIEYFTVVSGVEKPFATVSQSPFSVKVLGPEAPATGATFTVGAQAYDTSGNQGPKATATWTVKPNAAPVNVTVTPLQQSAYPSAPIGVVVTFDDEGSFVTVTTTFTTPKNNGSVETKSLTQSYSRLANGSWPEVKALHTLPNDARAGEAVSVRTTVADVRGLTSTAGTAAIQIAADLVAPSILSVTPPAGTIFDNADKFAVEAIASDGESGVQTVTFFVDGVAHAVASSELGPTPGTRRFRSVQIEARARAVDADIPVVVTAKDWNGNTVTKSHDILYRGVNDPDAPQVTWLCPIDLAALPALRSNFVLNLRVNVVDEDARSVKFLIGNDGTTLTGTLLSGTEYGATHTFSQTPPAGAFPIRVVVEDTVAAHTVELPVTVKFVGTDFVFSDPRAITAADAASFAGKSVALIGPEAVLVPHVPVTFSNLLVLGGARVETLPTDFDREFRLDITTTGTTYVDCASRIDVTEKGYLGGRGSVTQAANPDYRGRTVGNTTVGGADEFSSASHAGVGASHQEGKSTNAVYGSIMKPVDLGSGGGGETGGGTVPRAGGSGGGAIALRGGTGENDESLIVIAGSVRADGGHGFGAGSAGAGGSVWIEAKQVLFGSSARASANGGDKDGVGVGAAGAGGGRVAMGATLKLDTQNALVQARGGRNLSTVDARYGLDGGAGTIYVRKPGQQLGELIVSSFDSRYPSSLHLTLPTPLGRISGGTSTAIAANALTDSSRTFDRAAIGEELVIAGDASRAFSVIGVSSDGKTLQTDPLDGSLLSVATLQSVPYAGRLQFDRVTAGKRALLVFDDHVAAGGIVDDKIVMAIDPTAAVVLRGEVPLLTVTTTPAAGTNLVRDTSLAATYVAQAAAGVRKVTLEWSLESAPRVELPDYPATLTTGPLALPVPPTAPLSPATLRMTVLDRAGRTNQLPVRTWTVAENTSPVINSWIIAPASLSIHAGHDVVGTVTATDDLAVKSIAFDARLNGTSIKTASSSPNTAQATQQFTVFVSNDVAGGSTLTMAVSVADGFAGRAATIASQTVNILQDTNAPQLTILSPAANATYRESVDTIAVRVTAVDAEVAVKEGYAQLEGGSPVPLTRVGTTSEWRADITAPPVDGTSDIQRSITVTARDYAGNTAVSNPVPVTIRAIVDSTAPALKWLCASGAGAMFPPGYGVKLRVSAIAATTPTGPNPVQAVEMTVNDTTALTVVSLGNNQYEGTFAVPANASEGTVYRVRAVARSGGGAASDLLTTFTVAVPTVAPITANTTIDPSVTTYDNQTVVIQGGTVTIRGPHTFDRLLVLGGTVVAPNLETLQISTTRDLYVSCDAAVTMTGRGYSNSTYPNETLPTNYTGGSHIGYGGEWSGVRGSTFGSVYRPREMGGGGPGGSVGGGVVSITAQAVFVDGSISATGGTTEVSGGGGGSIRIRTQSIAGAGSVEASGGTSKIGYGSGGGGAIAIEYSSPASVLPVLRSISGSAGTIGAPGSIYILGPSSTYGDLRIDHGGLNGQQTKLPSLGSGVAQPAPSGATVVTNRTADIPLYFEGHWVEIRDAAGVLKGTWRIATVSGKAFTLEGAGISVAQGDLWQGVYRFDNVVLTGARLENSDPVRVADTERIEGAVELEAVSAKNLRVVAGGSITHVRGRALVIDVTGELRIDSGAKIDVSGRGYALGATYPGETVPTNDSGGSHIGFGGEWNGGARGSTFGSIYQPAEKGGSGPGGSVGGGVVRMTAMALIVDGSIAANGTTENVSGGGGGSIWIRTQSMSGTGIVETNGGTSKNGYGSGGGGAIAIESTVPGIGGGPVLRSRSGTAGSLGAAGSAYTFEPGSTYGSVTIDNTGIPSAQATALPSLGRGRVVNVTGGVTVITDRSSIQPYFAGHWVDVFAPGGSRKGTWRIAAIEGGSFKLAGTPEVVAGDTWRGVYLFDTVKLRNAKVVLLDDLRASRDLDASSSLTVNELPVFDPAKLAAIVVTSTPENDFVTGPAGAVTDIHTPIVMTARNVRTGQTFTANAMGDGSFRVPVTGEIGDTFTLFATDTFSVPATTATIAVNGSITSVTSPASVSVEPSSATGGAIVAGTIRMLHPVRRASDGVVALTSSDPSAIVPATMTVPFGGSSATFDIQTRSVAATTPVIITATSGGASRSATLTLLAGTSLFPQLTFDEATVDGGTSINALVVLGAPAGAGGAVVAVSSSDTSLASVPATVVVPQGATSLVFTVTTRPVAVTGNVTITASYGATVSATATLAACPQLAGRVAPLASTGVETLWVDDSLPAGATPTGDGTIDSTQSASGSMAAHLRGATAGVRTFAFTGGVPLAVGPNDRLIVYALINPCDPPRQILIGWTSGTTTYRASWGESRIEPTTTDVRSGAVPHDREWVRLEVLARSLGITTTVSITGFSIRSVDGEAWFDAIGTSACAVTTAARPPQLGPPEMLWFDDDLPAGATAPVATALDSAWQWTAQQTAGGLRSHLEASRTGTHQHSFTGATTPLLPAQGDVLTTYVLIDPCNPPRQLMLQWNDGTWDHRAYWGENLIPANVIGAQRTRMGPMPEAGKWVRLEVPAAMVGLINRSITGMAFTLYDGQAWFDRAGKVSRVNVALGKPATQSTTSKNEERASLAVDGNIATGQGSTSATTYQSRPWWEVDLGAVYAIDTIDIHGGNDCCPLQTSEFYILVSDAPFGSEDLDATLAQRGVSAYSFVGAVGRLHVARIRKTGRYVRIHMWRAEHLTLSEVQVWTPASSSRVNLAGGRSTTSSSSYDSQSVSHVAVNGAVNHPHLSGASIFHTKSSELEPWLEVDLGAVVPISSVDVWARVDGWPEQLTTFYVFVSDVPFASKSLTPTLEQAGVSGYYHHIAQLPVISLPVNRTGRHVRVQKTGTSFMSMDELQVWSQRATLPALSRPEESPHDR